MTTDFEHVLAERKARQSARELLARYAIEKPEHIILEGLAAELGVTVVEGALQGAVARLARIGSCGRIRVSTAVTNAGRRRFSIGHELGHFVLSHADASWLGCLEHDLVDFGGRRHAETQANIFAVELILPEHLVRRRCEVSPVTLEPVLKLATDFQTSITSTAIRFVEFSPEQCAIVFSVDEKIRWTKKSETFWCRLPGWGEPLDSACLAVDFFKNGQMSEEPEDVRASAWVDGAAADRIGWISEHSVAIPSVNGVLTLLWIPVS